MLTCTILCLINIVGAEWIYICADMDQILL